MTTQKQLALDLMQYHGGQNSPLYAVASCMFADSERGESYSPQKHGHQKILEEAICELIFMKIRARYPENVDQEECDGLVKRLRSLIADVNLNRKFLAKAEEIISSDLDWEEKYDLIFSKEISIAFANKNSSFDYCDPDTSYKEDVMAWYNAAKNFVDGEK